MHPLPAPACSGSILVVDDDDLSLRVCVGVLKRAGFEVEGLRDPTCVVERLRAGRFDAVLSDVRMPHIDGVQLLKAIRAMDREIPVLLMTGQPTVEAAIQALEHRALRMLQKPLEVDALVEATREAVRSRASAAPSALHRTLDRSLASLHMAYQPIIGAHAARPMAWEALVRCKAGAANALELITTAERTGRLVELGRAIRDLVARDSSQLPDDALLFVNVHPRDLTDPHLAAPDAPLSKVAHRVVLEITERSGLEEVAELSERLAALRALGFRLAVDDLGAGYAGLSTLASIGPEFVKLDGSLVRDLPASPRSQLVVSSMLGLAQRLGSQVIAECIETALERDALVTLGIDLMQGYYFARPGPPFPAPTAVVPAA